jgi:hypothetical protein
MVAWVCVCICTCSRGYYLVGPCVDVFICIPTTSREWQSVREMERERESLASVRKMRRVGPTRDDVNSACRIRLRPSRDVKVRYRDARLRRKISKRW